MIFGPLTVRVAALLLYSAVPPCCPGLELHHLENVHLNHFKVEKQHNISRVVTLGR